MPRVSFSNDYVLDDSCRTFDSINRYSQCSSLISEIPIEKQPSKVSPTEIDAILSRKLYEQIKSTSESEIVEENRTRKCQTIVNPLPQLTIGSIPSSVIDSELLVLIDRFFNLTYLNTIPMVNLLTTALATNFLKENIRTLNKKLKEQQGTHASFDIKRGTSLRCDYENGNDNDDDDDSLSWASAPT